MNQWREHDEEDGRLIEKAPRKHRAWKCMPYILSNETAEKLATYGLTSNLQLYMMTHFGMKEVAATNTANVLSGSLSFAPVAGAFISDTYLGRFRTIIYGSFAILLGMIILTLSSSVPHLKPPSCSLVEVALGKCISPTKLQVAVIYTSFAFLIVGSGGVRPCSLPFGIDQFDKTDKKHRMGLKRFYNWYYGTTTLAIFLAYTVIVYIQSNISWTVGFAIPTGLMMFSIVIFFLGSRLYVYVIPEESVFQRIFQVFVASFFKRNLRISSPDDLYDPPLSGARELKLPLSSNFNFLNKAAIIREGDLNSDGFLKSKWKLCTVQQVEELKCLIRIIPVWISGMMCILIFVLMSNYSYLQALTMDLNLRNFQVPAASLAAFSYLALTLFIPLYDLVLVPAVQKVTKIEGGITVLQRQGIGLVLASLSMVIAGLIEHKRRNSALSNGGTSPLTAFWLAPQLILTGLAASFNLIGQIELYNTQFPEHMQTLAMALYYTTEGGASYLATLTTNIINKITEKDGIGWVNDNITAGRLDYFYYCVAIFGVVDLLYFLVCAHFYRYKAKKPKEDDINEILKSNIRSFTSPQMVPHNRAIARLDRNMTA